MSPDFLLPAGGEGAADRVPEHGGEPGGPGQDGGAAPPPQRGEHPGSHHPHQGHLRLQTNRGTAPSVHIVLLEHAGCLFCPLPLSEEFL